MLSFLLPFPCPSQISSCFSLSFVGPQPAVVVETVLVAQLAVLFQITFALLIVPAAVASVEAGLDHLVYLKYHAMAQVEPCVDLS